MKGLYRVMYLINGQEVSKEDFSIPVEDMIVWRGDGIFEAIRIHEGFPFGLEHHLERMTSSARKLNIKIDINNIRQDILKVAGSTDNGYVRVIISRGTDKKEFQVFTFLQPIIDFPEDFTLHAQKAPWHPAGDFTESEFSAMGVKSTSYALNMYHTRLAKEEGFTDALLLSRNNIVLEGPTFSIGWVVNDKIFTPSLNLGILGSVTRKYLFTICKENKIEIEEVESSFDILSEADGVFILSTAKHAVAISRVNDIFYEENNLIHHLQNLYSQLVESERYKFN